MENRNKKRRAIIISIIILLVLVFVLFLIYKNKDSFGVKTSSVITKIFSPLETSENKKKELIVAGEDIKKGDGVVDAGIVGDTRTVRRAMSGEYVFGYAVSDIPFGEIGEISLSTDSFWDSVSGFLGKTFDFKYKAICQDGKDNDGDGLIDALDPNCHIDGDLNKEYVPTHYSESESPVGKILDVCSDGIDNDGDGLIDALDPNCHIDGDLNKEYIPTHYSESENPFREAEGIDIVASIVSPTRGQVNTEVNLSSVITNIGAVETGQSFVVLFSISEIMEGLSDKNIHLTTTSSALLPGSKDQATVRYTFANTGTYYIRACADKKDVADEGLIPETNELNNCGGWTTFTVTNVLPNTGNRPACSDGIDNDGDGLIDILDPNCHIGGDINKEYLPDYNSESISPTECSDTIDNDGDGLIDVLDPNCHVGGDINKAYLPNYNSESRTPTECSDTIDNDGDKLIDALDPNCHVGGLITNEYKADHDSESTSPATPNVCLDIEQNPLIFTDEEQEKLDGLLRKFYLISPGLKADTDIALVYEEINNQRNFMNQLDVMIRECYAQTSDPNYKGPTEKYGNPWFKYDIRGSYITDLSNSNSYSYCKTNPTTGSGSSHTKNCSNFKTRDTCQGVFAKKTCTWVETTNLREYEILLNIW